MRLDAVPWFRAAPWLPTWHAFRRCLGFGVSVAYCGREIVSQGRLVSRVTLPRSNRCKVSEERVRRA